MDDWQKLTDMTGSKPLIIERIRIAGSEIRIEGEFEPPPLAGLKAEDQIFVASFVRAHGSIKKMEELFGLSYPSIKNRLNRISPLLDFIDVPVAAENCSPDSADVLDRLSQGEIDVETALEEIRSR